MPGKKAAACREWLILRQTICRFLKEYMHEE
jgi:hypothetical protein